MSDAPAPVPPAEGFPVRPAWWENGPRWPGRAELRADLGPALRFAAVIALAGVPAGLLWWGLAPREDYRVVENGVEALGRTSAELPVADDGVLILVMAGLGLLAGIAAWLLRRRRGVAVLAALALGTLLAGLLAWQLGELLGPGPTEEQLAEVGATVTTPLRLASLPALTAAPFLSVLTYVVAALFAPSEDLDRPAGPAASRAPGPSAEAPGGRRLVDVPPPGRPAP